MKEVTEIIEIVFERVQLQKMVEVLTIALSNSTLKDYTISTDSSEINLHSKEKLFDSINQSSDGSFYFNFLNFRLKDILLTRAGFQIYKYNNIYDLNIAIEAIELKQKTSVSDLKNCVKSLSEELKATNYYSGYEPAADEETRLFSRDSLGPINNWRNIDN